MPSLENTEIQAKNINIKKDIKITWELKSSEQKTSLKSFAGWSKIWYVLIYIFFIGGWGGILSFTLTDSNMLLLNFRKYHNLFNACN